MVVTVTVDVDVGAVVIIVLIPSLTVVVSFELETIVAVDEGTLFVNKAV